MGVWGKKGYWIAATIERGDRVRKRTEGTPAYMGGGEGLRQIKSARERRTKERGKI